MSKKGAWQWKLLHFLGNRRRPKTSEKVHEKDRKRKKENGLDSKRPELGKSNF